MSRKAALDLRQVTRECYDAAVAMSLQRSRSFRRPTNCTIPDSHSTLVHRQSELSARGVLAAAAIVARATIAGLWATPPAVTNTAENPAFI